MKETSIPHLVKGEDLNHHGTLFAGRMAGWFTVYGKCHRSNDTAVRVAGYITFGVVDAQGILKSIWNNYQKGLTGLPVRWQTR